jgi:hypothetical protein
MAEPRQFDNLEIRRGRPGGRPHTINRHEVYEPQIGQREVSDPAPIVRALLAQFYETCEISPDPESVNDEWLCGDFGTRLYDLLPGAVLWDGKYGHTEMGSPYEHLFVEFRGRYYDSETPEGVSDPTELPFFHRADRAQNGLWGRGSDDEIRMTKIAPTAMHREKVREETYTFTPRTSALMEE